MTAATPTATPPAVTPPQPTQVLTSVESPTTEREGPPDRPPDTAGGRLARASSPRSLLRRLGMFGAVAVLTTVLLNPGPGLGQDHASSRYTVRITGTPAERFICAYTIVAPDGSETSRVVEGVVPAEFTVQAASLSTTIQKPSAVGSLKVEIVRGSSVVSHAETSAAAGMVIASTN